jgi:hypothetical protein
LDNVGDPAAKVNREMMEAAKELVGVEGLEPTFLGQWIQVQHLVQFFIVLK